MTLVQTEPKHIYYGEPIIVSDMQGPCPDGFHVPTKDEWVALCGILTSTFGLAQKATTMGTYLKMPMNGYRYNTNASVFDVGSSGRYWSSTPYSAYDAYYFYSDNYGIYPQNNDRRTYGFAVRSFKNFPAIPTSSWTTLYQGSGSAGIFWNSTDGLISVSGNGTTWYTIMDKNLGATTVYNQGDTLTDANCGYFYQRGNNYGFPHSGTVTTSSTQINATDYGPGNYYNSSTFITSSNDRSSVQNNNLRGGVSQGISEKPKEVKAVYLGTTKVRPTPIYSYSYTFKGKTASQISNDWDTLVGTINTNSDGVTGTANSELRIKVDIPSLATAKKITISGTLVVNQNSQNGMSFLIGTGSGWGNGFAGGNVYGSNFHGISTNYYNGSDHFGNVVGYSTIGMYSPTITIDLENKTIKETLSGFSDSTNTFTNSDIATIRQFNQLIVYVFMNKTAVSDVSITIE